MLNLGLLTFTGACLVAIFLVFVLLKLFEVAFVVSQLLVLEVDNFLASGVEEVTGV